MDIASAVYRLTVGIVNFISEHEGKGVLHDQISNIVMQIQSVVAPLMLRDITDEPFNQVLQSLQHVLFTVDGHLRSWKESRTRRVFAAVNPWAVTSEIREDRVQLMHQYIMLMGAMQIIDHVKGYNLLLPDGADPQPTADPSKEVETHATPALKEVSGEDDGASLFWRSCVGSDLEVAEAQQFCDALSRWLGRKLNLVSRKRLLLRLDENDTGHVTLKTLQDLVRDDDMKKVVNLYMADPVFPLLVWISDDISINKPKVAFAQKKGVCVVQLSSTKTAKAWLRVNKSILKKHDTPGDLRFISDQCRHELNDRGEVFNNRKAGEHITEFIRNEGFKAPLLIFTIKRNIHTTRYVDLYPMTGSIGSNYKRFNQFVSALAERRTDDKGWVGFDR